MAPPDPTRSSSPMSSRRCELAEPIPELIHSDYDRFSSYNWNEYLQMSEENRDAFVAVEKLQDAPLHDVFHHLRAGLKVEVINHDFVKYSHSLGGVFWVAHVLEVAGYKALMRYEGFGTDASHDFWINLCCAHVHPVGWCANETKPLVPPKAIATKESDWKAFLVRRLTGSRTLPADWGDRVKKALTACRFKVGDRLELLDRMRSTRVRPAIVKRVVGHRMMLELSQKDRGTDDEPEEDQQVESGDWVDQSSPLIFPVGWAMRSGYGLTATNAYKQHCEKIVAADPDGKGIGSAYNSNDARPEQFHIWKKRRAEKDVDASIMRWVKGMKLECLDPLDKLNALAVASVLDVLPGGYLRLGFDGPEIEEDSIAIHSSSSHLFPIGYAETHSIELRPPKGVEWWRKWVMNGGKLGGGESGKEPLVEPITGVETKFNWETYLQQTQAVGAPSQFFDENYADCSFKVGEKLEAVDKVEPHLICVGTIAAKKGRLIKIHYEGWEDAYDQLFDYRSEDIMPLGWCEMMGYKLEAPKTLTPAGNKRKSTSSGASITSKKPKSG